MARWLPQSSKLVGGGAEPASVGSTPTPSRSRFPAPSLWMKEIEMLTPHATLIDPSSSSKVMKIEAQALADQYLADTLGSNFRAANGFFGNQCWYFLIHYQNDTDSEPIGMGAKLVVDTQQCAVHPLTSEQTQDILESPHVQMAQARGEFARGSDGYLLRYQAKRNATAYLRVHLSMQFSAVGGLFVPLPQAIWQFSIRCHVAQGGELGPLGIVDVDARSGGVLPLQTSHLQQIRNWVDAIIQHRPLATAA